MLKIKNKLSNLVFRLKSLKNTQFSWKHIHVVIIVHSINHKINDGKEEMMHQPLFLQCQCSINTCYCRSDKNYDEKYINRFNNWCIIIPNSYLEYDTHDDECDASENAVDLRSWKTSEVFLHILLFSFNSKKQNFVTIWSIDNDRLLRL